MADLKTTNIYGDAYINNKVGIATNAPATRLQIGQLSPTAATEGIQFGDDTSTRIYRSGTGAITVAGSLTYPTATVSGYITFPNDTNAAGLINTAGTAWLKLDDAYGNMYIVNNQSGAGIYFDSNAYYWRNSNGATTLLSLSGNGDLGAARYLSGTYVNTSDDVSTGNISHIVAKFGDNYHRSATAAKVAAFISGQTMNIGGNAATVTTNANLSGDVTSVGNTTTIANTVVTNAKLKEMGASTIKGNNSGTATTPSDLTPAQVATMLNNQTMNINGSSTSCTGNAVTATTATALTSMNISQFTNNSGYLTSAVTSLAGTTNRITVSGATGAVTLNLPQDIHTGASPSFSGLTVTGITMTNLTGAYQNTTVYDSPRTQSATPSRGIRAPASSIQFTDSYAIAPFYTYRSTGDWPVPYGIGWGTGGESSGIFQRYAANGYSFGDMIFYTGNDGSGAFSFRRHTWEGTTYFAAGSGELNTELFRIDWAGKATAISFGLTGGFVIDADGGYGRFNNWVNLNGFFGLFSGNNNAHIYPNNGSYGSWKMEGTRNGWGGIEFGNNGVSLMMGSDTVGFHQNTNGWLFRVHNGSGFIYKGAWGGGTAATIYDTTNGNGVLLRAAGGPGGYGDWNTFGNVTQTTNFITTEYFNLNGGSGNSNFPPVVSYTYGILTNLGSGGDARAQIYISHAGNDLIFRGGWGTASWQTWNRCLTNVNSPYAYNMNQYVRTTDSPTFATITGTGEVVWSGYNSGNARAVRIGYSGGNYGGISYGINYTATSNSHTYAFNDAVTRIDLADGIQVYSAAGAAANTPVTWSTLLVGYRGNTYLQWKGNNVIDTSYSGTVSGLSIGGNAATATTLQTGRAINGVSFNGSAAITVNGLNYNVNNDWLRENGDDDQFKLYGNSRTMIYRTDGNTNAHGGGGYAHIFYYGGSADANRMFIINTDGRLWSNYHGWLDAMSITGNAATATSADNIDGRPFVNTNSNSGTNADSINSNGISYYTSGVTNFSGNATDGGLYSQAYSNDWQHQIAGDYRSGQIALRGKNSGTWQSWRRVLDDTNSPYALNMNQYVRTTDTCSFAGLTVSNTINGSVTGNAATATTATSAGCINSDTGNVGENRLQYWQVSGNTTLNPDGEWYNAIRMGHGNPVTYYGNTLAIRMTGGNLGDIYTRTLTNGTQGSWNRFWHNNNDGAGSGLDADLVDGKGLAIAATADTIVLRDASGHITGQYILGSYFNASAGNGENPTIGQIWTQNTTDNYLRKSTPAHFRSQVTDGSYPSLTGANASGTWSISVTGNAGTATSAVTAGSCTGNAGTATTLQTARNINGTSFNGSAAITTATWGTARTLTIGNTGKSVDGSGNVSWTLAEIGASGTTVNSGNTSAAWYPIVWHSGNTLYSTAGVQIYAGGSYVQAAYFNSSDNDETGITRFIIKNGDGYHRSATTTTAADVIRGVASGNWSINVTGTAGSISGYNNPATGASANSIAYRDGNADLTTRYFMANRSSAGAGQCGVQLQTSGTTKWWMYLRQSDDNVLAFYTSNATADDVVRMSSTGLGIKVDPSNRLHINGDGTNPAIRIDNPALGSGASNSRGFYGWLPISIGGVGTKYIQLYN